jgi:hypothetical protein
MKLCFRFGAIAANAYLKRAEIAKYPAAFFTLFLLFPHVFFVLSFLQNLMQK